MSLTMSPTPSGVRGCSSWGHGLVDEALSAPVRSGALSYKFEPLGGPGAQDRLRLIDSLDSTRQTVSNLLAITARLGQYGDVQRKGCGCERLCHLVKQAAYGVWLITGGYHIPADCHASPAALKPVKT